MDCCSLGVIALNSRKSKESVLVASILKITLHLQPLYSLQSWDLTLDILPKVYIALVLAHMGSGQFSCHTNTHDNGSIKIQKILGSMQYFHLACANTSYCP